jgi:biotin carboxyl carrier protein
VGDVPARRALVSIVLAVVAAASAASPAAARWVRPAAGEVTRGFDIGADPFAAGRHRGVDFAAAPGSGVRAPCAGRVVVAARIGSSGGVVTVACGRWRVSQLPLGHIGVVVGQRVRAGAPLGSVEASSRHAGVHLGVRRAGRPFGYVDPLRFLGRGRRVPPAGPVRPGRVRPRAPVAAPPAAPQPSGAPGGIPAPVSGGAPLPLAPWPAWAGLAGLLLVTAGRGGLRLRSGGRPRRAAVSRAGLLEVP